MFKYITGTALVVAVLFASTSVFAGADTGCTWAKQQPNGTPAEFGDLVVTAKFTGYIYAQHTKGQAGIRIVTSDTTVNEGDLIFVHGTVGTSGHERVINATTIDRITPNWGHAPARAMANRDVAGGTLGVWPNCQAGAVGGMGVNNVGLLVRTWGKVTDREPDYHYVIIDDGCGTSVKIDCTRCSSLPEMDDYIGATGICSLHSMGLRLIIARDDPDVTVYSHPGS